MLGAEGAEALLAEGSGRRRRRVALKERQCDLAGHVGENCLPAGPEGVEGGLELVVGRDPLGHQVGSGPHRGAQGTGVLAVGLEWSQPMDAQTQVLADGLGVTGVGLGPGGDLGLAPRLDRIRRHRHHGVAGFQQSVHQPPIGSLDGHGQLGRLAVAGQSADEVLEPDGAVRDGERGQFATCAVVHAHGVFLRRPVDACEHSNLLECVVAALDDEDPARAVTDWRSRRIPLLPVSSPRRGPEAAVSFWPSRGVLERSRSLRPSPRARNPRREAHSPDGGPVTLTNPRAGADWLWAG